MTVEFAINAGALLTVVGAAVTSSLIALWVKHYLANWRFTPLVVLAITEALLFGAQLIVQQGRLTGDGALTAALVGLAAASLSVFGYEVVVNALGLAGVGPRSVAGQVERAKALLGKEQ